VGVLDPQQKTADLPNRSALRLLASVGLQNGTLPGKVFVEAPFRAAVLACPSCPAKAGRYKKLPASRFPPTAYWLLPTALMRPSTPARYHAITFQAIN